MKRIPCGPITPWSHSRPAKSFVTMQAAAAVLVLSAVHTLEPSCILSCHQDHGCGCATLLRKLDVIYMTCGLDQGTLIRSVLGAHIWHACWSQV